MKQHREDRESKLYMADVSKHFTGSDIVMYDSNNQLEFELCTPAPSRPLIML